MTAQDRFVPFIEDVEEDLRIAQRASSKQLRRMACLYDWSRCPEAVLGWIMAQKSVDLGTAMTVFFNGDPERFNYMPKRDVPADYRGVARVLDNICLRVNSGFYLVRPSKKARLSGRLAKWLDYQAADRREGRCGRWILDERIISDLTRKPETVTPGDLLPQGADEAQARSRIVGQSGPGLRERVAPVFDAQFRQRFQSLLQARPQKRS